MLDTLTCPPHLTSAPRHTIYRLRQQSLCGDCIARECACPPLILWLTGAKARACGFITCARCHCSLVGGLRQEVDKLAESNDRKVDRLEDD